VHAVRAVHFENFNSRLEYNTCIYRSVVDILEATPYFILH